MGLQVTKKTPALTEQDREDILVEFNRLVIGHATTVEQLLQWASMGAGLSDFGVFSEDVSAIIVEYMRGLRESNDRAVPRISSR